jgi:dTDP-4-amino-4,6-dideoxygalactose transaminase
MNKKINLFVPSFRTEEILEQIRECLNVGWTGLGFKTIEFENKWKEYTGLNNAHYLNSNTAGLHLALNIFKKKYNWNDGDEIITTPLTFIATNHAILYENLRPIFADIDEYLCLDPKSILNKITSKTKAIMFVGFGGNSGQLEEVSKICKEKGLIFILDAAHMAGTKLNGKHVGNEADVAIFSFQAVKNLPTGDSGMICFKDNELDKIVRKLSWMGINKDTYSRNNQGNYSWKYDVDDLGFKYHGNSIMASIGLIQLKYLEEDNKRRNEIAKLYDEMFNEIKEIETIKIPSNCYSSRHLYQIIVKNRDKLLDYLCSNNIFPGVHYICNTEYLMYSYAKGSCLNAERISNSILSLPIHLKLSNEDINLVVSHIKEYVQE